MFNLHLGYINLYNKLAKLCRITVMNYAKRMAMYRMLEKMTSEPASLQINEAIIELQLLELVKDKKNRLWHIYEDIIEQMRSTGANFAHALSRYVPEQDTMIIAAAEQDDITLGFTTVIENNLITQSMKNAFISALAYPCMLVLALLGVLYYFSVKIIPQMSDALPKGISLSEVSVMMIALSDEFSLWFPMLVCLLLFILLFIIWALPNFTNQYRKHLEELPPFNMYRIMVGCGFLFALNSLGRSGFMQIDALHHMLPLAKPYLRYRIEIVIDLMADGMDIGQALIYSRLNFPDKQMVRELAIQIKYSEDDSLEVLSKTLAEDGLATIKKQSVLLKFLITGIVFSVIGFLYIGVYTLGMDMGNMGNNF